MKLYTVVVFNLRMEENII